MAPIQANHPGNNSRHQSQWMSIRSAAAQERQRKLKQQAREGGESDEAIEGYYCRTTVAANEFLYRIHGTSEFRSTVNAELFYWLVDKFFHAWAVRTISAQDREDLLQQIRAFEDHEDWKTPQQRTSKPWSPEYLEYFTKRALIDGDGRGTATMEDGTIIKLRYVRIAAPQGGQPW